MTYPVKIEFKDYPSGSWIDWSNYLVEAPFISRRVESDNEGEAGVIVFDNASVSFYYTAGNPVYNAFNIDLTSKQRYLFRISAPKSDKNYVVLFEGMADFSTIRWPGLSNEIGFEIVDKLSALDLVASSFGRTRIDLWDRFINNGGIQELHVLYLNENGKDYLFIKSFDPFYGQYAGEYRDFTYTGILNVGEIFRYTDGDAEFEVLIKAPCVVFNDTDLDNGVQYYFSSIKVEIVKYSDPPFMSVPLVITSSYMNLFDKLFRGVDINVLDNGILQAFDAIKILDSIYRGTWNDFTLINRSGVSIYQIPLEYFPRLIDENPFGTDPLGALKTLADTMNCYIYIDRTGSLVIQSKNENNLSVSGITRTLGTTKVISKETNYFWDKLVDGATVKVKSWIKDAAGAYLEGQSTQTRQIPGSTSFIKPKNEISKELLTDNAADTTQTSLDNKAASEALNILNFYGARRSAVELMLHLDDNVLEWDLIDNIYFDSLQYFYVSLDLDLAERTAALTPVEVRGHTYDPRQIVVSLGENASTSSYIDSSSSPSGGGSAVSYIFNSPLLLNSGVVSLGISDSFKLTGNNLDAIQPIKITSTPQFAKIGIGKPADAAYPFAVLGDGWLTGNLKVDGNLYITGNINQVSQTNLDIADITISLNKGGDNTTAIGAGIIVKGTTDSNLATIIYDGAKWNFNFGLNIPTGTNFKINNASVLNETTLGAGVLNSSLTKVGILTIGEWKAAAIKADYIVYDTTQFQNNLGTLQSKTFNINGANGLTGNNIITLGGTATISHAAVAGALTNGAGSNVIQTLTRDVYGHITGNTVIDVRLLFSKADPLIYSSAAGQFGLNYNSTNLKITLSALNTIQDISTTSAPTFAGLTLNGNMMQNGNYSIYNNFTSGWAGSGFRIDYGVTDAGKASAEFDNLTVRGTFSVYELLVRQIRATNGNVFISAGAKVESVSGTLITFEDASNNNLCPFAVNDLIKAQRFNPSGSIIIRNVEATVTSVSGRTVTVVYNIGTFQAGDEVVRIGNTTTATRQASIYLASDDTNSPFIDIINGVNSWAAWGAASKTKARYGNLAGITDLELGTLSGYGLYADNVFLKGKIIASSGKIGNWNLINYTLTSQSGWRLLELNGNLGYIYAGYGIQFDSDVYIIMGEIPAASLSPYAGEIGLIARDNYYNKDFFVLTNLTKKIAGWSFDNQYFWSGTKQTVDGYSTSGITLGSNGTIYSPQFYIGTDGSAHYKGALEAASGTFSGDISAATGTFSGSIVATSGTIGGWAIGPSALSSTSNNVLINSSGSIQLKDNHDAYTYLDFGVDASGYSYLRFSVGAGTWNDIIRIGNLGHWNAGDVGKYGLGLFSNTNEVFHVDTSGSALIAGWSFDDVKLTKGSASLGFALNTSPIAFITGKGFEVYDYTDPKVFIGDKSGSQIDWNITTANQLTIKGTFRSSSFSTNAVVDGSQTGINIYSNIISAKQYFSVPTRTHQVIIQPDQLNVQYFNDQGTATSYISLLGGDGVKAVKVYDGSNTALYEAAQIYINTLQVLGTRKTGWGAATGTAARTTFDTSTVTTAALAQRVKALLDDLISHGLIGS